jgi:hypothetical protein
LLCFATKACGLFTTGSLLTQTTSSWPAIVWGQTLVRNDAVLMVSSS